jgi:tetratricopeptide (TPR) repeat protein
VLAHNTLGRVLADARRYNEALLAYQAAQALSPGSHYVEENIIDALLASGQIEQARQQCASSSTPLDEEYRHFCLTLAYHALGRHVDAESELEKLRALRGEPVAYEYAEIYAQWGNTTSALRWLPKAEQLRDPGFQSLRVSWEFDPIRNELQFKAIEARMKFPP